MNETQIYGCVEKLPKNSRLFLEVKLPGDVWMATSSIFPEEEYRLRAVDGYQDASTTWDRIERKHYDEQFGHRVDARLKKSCNNHAVGGFFGGVLFVMAAIAVIHFIGRYL